MTLIAEFETKNHADLYELEASLVYKSTFFKENYSCYTEKTCLNKIKQNK